MLALGAVSFFRIGQHLYCTDYEHFIVFSEFAMYTRINEIMRNLSFNKDTFILNAQSIIMQEER